MRGGITRGPAGAAALAASFTILRYLLLQFKVTLGTNNLEAVVRAAYLAPTLSFEEGSLLVLFRPLAGEAQSGGAQ